MPVHRNLPRLESGFYKGCVAVHWTFGIEMRAVGWLSEKFHSHFREILLHASVRYGFASPVYSLMPDHLHLMLWGIHDGADLYLAAKFIRKHTAQELLPALYQKQAYDHVLLDDECEESAFEKVCFYILENPVRGGLCEKASEYRFSGCVVPGYPDLNIHSKDYWNFYWKACHRLTAAATKICSLHFDNEV